MNERLRRFTTLICPIAFAAAVLAAPVKPEARRAPDELQCLAHINKIFVEFSPLPEVLGDAGVTDADIRRVATRLLTQHGFEIAEEPTTPKLVVSFRGMRDDGVSDETGYVVFVEEYQRVLVHRLERDLTLPTATLLGYGVKSDADVGDGLKEELRFVLKRFVGFQARATRVSEGS